MGPSAGTFMRSTAAPKVENETPRFLVKSDSAFLRTRAAISELQVSELRDTQQRESQRSRKWITMSESKFRHKNFHQTHALQTRSFIRCNRFAAPVFFFFCFVFGYLSPSKMLLRNCTQHTGSWKPSRIAPTDGRRSNDQRVHMDTDCQLAIDCNLAQNQRRKMAATTLTP